MECTRQQRFRRQIKHNGFRIVRQALPRQLSLLSSQSPALEVLPFIVRCQSPLASSFEPEPNNGPSITTCSRLLPITQPDDLGSLASSGDAFSSPEPIANMRIPGSSPANEGKCSDHSGGTSPAFEVFLFMDAISQNMVFTPAACSRHVVLRALRASVIIEMGINVSVGYA